MNNREYIFMCSEGLEDLEHLHQLFIIDSIDSEIQESSIVDAKMGFEEILIALISSAIIPQILHTINIWLQSRKKELIIIDKKTGKELKLESHNGKGFSDSDMEKARTFFKD